MLSCMKAHSHSLRAGTHDTGMATARPPRPGVTKDTWHVGDATKAAAEDDDELAGTRPTLALRRAQVLSKLWSVTQRRRNTA